MRTASSLLLAPALALLLTGCGRDDAARTGNARTDRAQQAQTAEPAGSPEATAPGTTAARQELESQARRDEAIAKSESRKTTRQSPKLAPYTGRMGAAPPRTDEATRQERDVDVPAGAVLRVRVDQALDTEKNDTGDKFTATLEEPVVVDGRVAIPKGTRFEGSITTAESSGRLSGKGVLTVKLDSFELNGKKHNITSTTATRVTDGHTKRDIGIIGGSAAAGAAIGAVTGGGKGAAIGAGAGAAAGTGVAAATGKQDVEVPAETVMVFTLQEAVDI
ncbi:MAG TPA: hypothetical protein VN428_25850 [Bryobacteraceae bacterium]|nr:hypothetical protein [Bryobacteraceae bacterium]